MKFLHKHFFKLILFICTPLYIVATIGAFFIAPFSLMAFDSPGSDTLWTPWIMVITCYLLAFSLVISDILIIIFSLKRKRRLLMYTLLLPWFFILVLVLIFTILPTF